MIYWIKWIGKRDFQVKDMDNNQIVNNQARIWCAKRGFIISIILTTIFIELFTVQLASGAEKKQKKQTPSKEVIINDSNLISHLKIAEGLVKKGDLRTPLDVFLKIYSFASDVLATIHLLQPEYEKIINDPSSDLRQKEDLYIKLGRMKELTPKYIGVKEASAYYMGYIYAKMGDHEKARRYLIEALEITSFSVDKNSIWQKTKRLLLELYGLEGEF